MRELVRSLTAALPLIAVVAVAAVFGYCWALFRNFDGEWVRTLTPGDVFSIGWSLTPGLLIGVAISQHQRQSEKRTLSKPSPSKWRRMWVISRHISGFLILTTGLVAFLNPFARDITESWSIVYMMIALWVTVAFAFISVTLLSYSIDDYATYHRRTWITLAVAIFVIIDALGARIRHADPRHIVQLENGQSFCANIIFSGQNAVYLHHAASGESAMIDRRLVRGLIQRADCDALNSARDSALSKILSSLPAPAAK
ncbi:Uncharacterised protein [Brevundimonas diminuta]|uniref:hypothetical protein n=1 Tax=Brevundimonas diminuta TaxID=293 RepID=UPI000D9A0017|nr:hypothetical protein [Brevundimonas diminuta]SPU47941.1 Uncharacterised protein [Brevundimonas diminuta]SUW15855.1 Uncharacterised protein [Brevundimonas diminuta]